MFQDWNSDEVKILSEQNSYCIFLQAKRKSILHWPRVPSFLPLGLKAHLCRFRPTNPPWNSKQIQLTHQLLGHDIQSYLIKVLAVDIGVYRRHGSIANSQSLEVDFEARNLVLIMDLLGNSGHIFSGVGLPKCKERVRLEFREQGEPLDQTFVQIHTNLFLSIGETRWCVAESWKEQAIT